MSCPHGGGVIVRGWRGRAVLLGAIAGVRLCARDSPGSHGPRLASHPQSCAWSARRDSSRPTTGNAGRAPPARNDTEPSGSTGTVPRIRFTPSDCTAKPPVRSKCKAACTSRCRSFPRYATRGGIWPCPRVRRERFDTRCCYKSFPPGGDRDSAAGPGYAVGDQRRQGPRRTGRA